MNELKTLKDIETSAYQEIFCGILKQEAIKWMKNFELCCLDEEEINLNEDFKNIRPMIKELMDFKRERGISDFDFEIIGIWIKHFFNINENS